MADQSVAASAVATQGQVLPLETRAATGFTHKWVIEASDINDADWTTDGDTVTVTLGNTPAWFIVDKAAYVVTTAFATDGTLTLQVGTDGDPDNFIDAQDAKTTGIYLADTSGTVKTEAGSSGKTADVLVARFTTQAATGNPADITAGRVEILLGITDVEDLLEVGSV